MAAVHIGLRTRIALGLVSLVGLVGFCWPLVAQPGSGTVAHAGDAPLLIALLLPLVVGTLLVSVVDGGIDSKALAMLGVLAAIAAALRPFGPAAAGIEPMWIIIILGARALGANFGFLLGITSMFVSALITGGVGPWLPFQMMAAAWVGLGAGLLPRTRSYRSELAVLIPYTFAAALMFGLLMNLWLWPWTPGLGSLSYVAGNEFGDNLARWVKFSLTSSFAWDISRALTTSVFIAIAGRPVLAALRRGARRANFTPSVSFKTSEQRPE